MRGESGVYHEQVVEEEHLSLVDPTSLGSVSVGHLIQLTATHQSPMRQGQHLQQAHTPTHTHADAQTHTQRHTNTHSDTNTQRHTNTHSDTHTDTPTHTAVSMPIQESFYLKLCCSQLAMSSCLLTNTVFSISLLTNTVLLF